MKARKVLVRAHSETIHLGDQRGFFLLPRGISGCLLWSHTQTLYKQRNEPAKPKQMSQQIQHWAHKATKPTPSRQFRAVIIQSHCHGWSIGLFAWAAQASCIYGALVNSEESSCFCCFTAGSLSFVLQKGGYLHEAPEVAKFLFQGCPGCRWGEWTITHLVETPFETPG